VICLIPVRNFSLGDEKIIFRLDGTVEETLALTPVIREWKEIGGDKALVDVNYPELFDGNPYVDGIADFTENADDVLIDFNKVDWQKHQRPVCESYAEYLFGKAGRLYTWRTEMYGNRAVKVPPKTAFLSLRQPISGLAEKVAGMGYTVDEPRGDSCGDWHTFRAYIGQCALFIGDDGDDAAVALTTDAPAVVVYTWRNPVYFKPFRRGLPFETVFSDCEQASQCLTLNGLCELGKTYGARCPMPNRFACESMPTVDKVIAAVEKLSR
jgi:hypothetical protein